MTHTIQKDSVRVPDLNLRGLLHVLQIAYTKGQGASSAAEIPADWQLHHREPAGSAGSPEVHAEGPEASGSLQGRGREASEGSPLAPAEEERSHLYHLQEH